MRKYTRVIVVAVSLVLCMAGGFAAAQNYRHILARISLVEYNVRGYPQNETVLIGSSFFDFWQTSEADLGPIHTHNLAVAGSTASDWIDYAATMVEPFSPEAIIIYAGSNDISGGKTGQSTAEELDKLFALLQELAPDAQLYYLSVMPYPGLADMWGEIETCNALVQQMAETNETLTYIQCTDVLLTENGEARFDLFRSDEIHLTKEGYEVWVAAFRRELQEVGLL